MRFLKGKAAYVAAALMVLVTLAAVVISIKVTITVVQRQEQEVRNIVPSVNDAAPASARIINTGKIAEHRLYFNGVEVKELTAYSYEKKEVLVPLDNILNYLGIEYSFYAPDDLLQSKVNGKTLVVRVGRDSFDYDGKEIKLPFAPVIVKGSVLVPMEMLSYIDGFSQKNILTVDSAFINYFGDMPLVSSARVKLLRLNSGFGGIWDMTGRRSLWEREEISGDEEMFEAAPGNSAFVFKSGSRVYMINPDLNPEPYLINADAGCTWSGDGKSLFWEDSGTGRLNIYNIEKDTINHQENFLWRAESKEGYEGFSAASRKLEEFIEHGSYKKVSFKNIYSEKTYTMVQKNSRITAEGEVIASPDGKRIIFTRQDGAYYVSAFDGTGAVKLGNGTSAQWVTNNRIFIGNGEAGSLYDASGKERESGEKRWKFLGKASDGAIFYTDGQMLYCDQDGIEKTIMALPWGYDHVVAASAEGPYILASEKNDEVLYYTEKGVSRIGRYSDMISGSGGLDEEEAYEKSIQVSPGKDALLFIHREEGLLTLDFMVKEGYLNKKVALDFTVPEIPGTYDIKVKWLDGRRVVLYTSSELWMVDFQDRVQIYKYNEKEGSSIKGVLGSL